MKEQNAREWLIRNYFCKEGMEWFDSNFSPETTFIELWNKTDNLKYLFYFIKRLAMTSSLKLEKAYFLSKLVYLTNFHLGVNAHLFKQIGLLSHQNLKHCQQFLNSNLEIEPFEEWDKKFNKLSQEPITVRENLYYAFKLRNINACAVVKNLEVFRNAFKLKFSATGYFQVERKRIEEIKDHLRYSILTAHEHHFNCRFYSHLVNEEFCKACNKIIKERKNQMIDRSLTISVPYTREDGIEPSLTFKYTRKVGTLYLNDEIIFDTGLDSEEDFKKAKDFARGLALLAKELETFCNVNK